MTNRKLIEVSELREQVADQAKVVLALAERADRQPFGISEQFAATLRALAG